MSTVLATHRLGYRYTLGTTKSFTAASDNFELAIAVAVATYRANSDQALASTVGLPIEISVRAALVYVMRRIGRRTSWEE